MLATTLEILRAINRNVVKVGTLASGSLAFDLAACALQEVMPLVGMVTETFGGRTYCLAAKSLRIVPTSVQSILCQLRVILLVVLELLLGHQYATIIAH
jgi:hypothetical protein